MSRSFTSCLERADRFQFFYNAAKEGLESLASAHAEFMSPSVSHLMK
jgi:hypothetical protein